MKIRLILVDDQKLFLESLKIVVEHADPDIEVVGMAENGRDAVELTDRLKPDLVLMDVRMPVMDGVEAVRILKHRYPALHIVMLTTFEDDEYVRDALTFGAAGYLLKNIPSSELIAAIRAVASGAVSIDPRVVAQLLRGGSSAGGTVEAQNSGSAPAERQAAGNGRTNRIPWLDELSRKERQILGSMVQGLSNSEIAEQANIAEQTVRNYVSRIYTKLGVTNRVQAVSVARQSGLY